MNNSSDIVIVQPLAYKLLLQSNGSQTYRFFELDLPAIARLGPQLASIRVETLTEGRTSQHQWKVVLFYSLDGKLWSPPVDLTTEVNTDGDVVHAAFTDETKFGLHIRLGLAVRSASGNALDSAVVSAVAFLRKVS
jgi:hypothetical protein